MDKYGMQTFNIAIVYPRGAYIRWGLTPATDIYFYFPTCRSAFVAGSDFPDQKVSQTFCLGT